MSLLAFSSGVPVVVLSAAADAAVVASASTTAHVLASFMIWLRVDCIIPPRRPTSLVPTKHDVSQMSRVAILLGRREEHRKLRGNINGQASVCDGYFNSAFRTFASRSPANAICFRAT